MTRKWSAKETPKGERSMDDDEMRWRFNRKGEREDGVDREDREAGSRMVKGIKST